MHLLLITTSTGYQTRSIAAAAEAVGAQLTIASDRCDQMDDPWRDQAVAVRFERPRAAVTALRAAGPFDGILASGDRAAVLAAQVGEALGLAFHSAEAARLCHDKFAFKQCLAAAGLPTPWFDSFAVEADARAIAAEVPYPCVLKPLLLAASRGVIRSNTPEEFAAAFARIRRLLAADEIAHWGEPTAGWIQVEEFLPGAEYAIEGWMTAAGLRTFALFDKPDPLDGPYFEETLYVTPSRLAAEEQARIRNAVAAAARAAELGPGPVHAEVRVARGTPCVLEIAARPIGGLCARTLRFQHALTGAEAGLEEVLVRAALGETLNPWRREARASGVYMIPIPRAGMLDGVDGVAAARCVPGIESVEITAKPGEALRPLPEGATYLGFLFARGESPEAVEAALREAHARLEIRMREALPVLRKREP